MTSVRSQIRYKSSVSCRRAFADCWTAGHHEENR